MVIHAKRAGYLPPWGWQLCLEICILSANSVRLVWSDAVLLYLNFILDKIVEMGATYVGGKENNNYASKCMNTGRSTIGKLPVIGMRQCGSKVKAEAIEAEYRQAVLNAIGPTVKPWTRIYTDDHRTYNVIKSAPFNLETVRHSAKEYVNGLVHTNRPRKCLDNFETLYYRTVASSFRQAPAKVCR